jgi:hypothetical protein
MTDPRATALSNLSSTERYAHNPQLSAKEAFAGGV